MSGGLLAQGQAWRWAVRSTSALAAMTVIAACAPGGGLDVRALEAELIASLLPDRPGAVAQVDCPEPLDPIAGEVVACVASIGDQQADVQLTFGEEQGAYTASVLNRLIDADRLERQIATQFVNDLQLTTTVACPRPVVVLGPDGGTQCLAVDHAGVERGLLVAVGLDGVIEIDLA